LNVTLLPAAGADTDPIDPPKAIAIT
jgi:hypothetical protein